MKELQWRRLDMIRPSEEERCLILSEQGQVSIAQYWNLPDRSIFADLDGTVLPLNLVKYWMPAQDLADLVPKQM